MQRPWETVCSHYEDNKWPVLINTRREKKQVKPPTILPAASWPRLQFQLTPVDDAAANHRWLATAAWTERAGWPPDKRARTFLKPTRAHCIWKPFASVLRCCQSAHFYLQTWLQGANENLLDWSTWCFSYIFRFRSLIRCIPRRLGSSLKLRFYIKPTFTHSHSHNGKQQPWRVWENRYSAAEIRRCSNFKRQLG